MDPASSDIAVMTEIRQILGQRESARSSIFGCRCLPCTLLHMTALQADAICCR